MKVKSPFNLKMNREDIKFEISVKGNVTSLQKDDEVYLMPSVHHEDNVFSLDINYQDNHLNIKNNKEQSLIPQHLNINITNMKEIEVDGAYKICNSTGNKKYFFL